MRKKRKRTKPRPTDYTEYLHSEDWQQVREKVLQRDGRWCVLCDEPATQVHHRNYLGTGEEKQRDLLSVCRRCHDWIHTEGVALPRVMKGSGKRGKSLRLVREAAKAAGHPQADPASAGVHASRNASIAQAANHQARVLAAQRP